jgi:hypothetical protein
MSIVCQGKERIHRALFKFLFIQLEICFLKNDMYINIK